MIRGRSTAYDRNEFRLIQYAKLLFISFPDAQDNVFVFFFRRRTIWNPLAVALENANWTMIFPSKVSVLFEPLARRKMYFVGKA